MELLKEIGALVIYVLITGCAVAIVKKVLDTANAKIDELQTTTELAKYDKLNALIDQAQSVIGTIVQSINQTFVNELKNAGKFDKESATKAKDMALDMANKLITEETANAIEQVYGDVDEYLGILVEQIVNQLKQNNK